MLRILMLAAGIALPLAAQAQATYRCTGTDGKKYYGSTIPIQCGGTPVEQLNKQGLVVRRIDPEGDEKARQEKEANAAKKRDEEFATREDTRRNRALLATYTSERDIEDARNRALADNQKAMNEVDGKIQTLRKQRAFKMQQVDTYKKDNKPAPASLADDIRNAEIDLKAQEDLMATKQKEVVSINAKYDEDKKRYVELTKPKPMK